MPGVEYNGLAGDVVKDQTPMDGSMTQLLKQDPGALRHAIEASKKAGNDAFKKKRYAGKIIFYLACCPMFKCSI